MVQATENTSMPTFTFLARDYQFTGYSVILIVAAAIGLIVAAASFRRRATTGAVALGLQSLAVAAWAMPIVLEAAATTLPLKVTWSKIAYPGTSTVSVFYCLFVLIYTQHNERLTRRNIGLLFVIPALTCLAAFTNEWHHWLWTDITIDPRTNLAQYGHGPWFWVFVTYTYSVLCVAVVTLYRSIFTLSAPYRPRAELLILGSTIPLAGNIVYLFGLNPIPGLDWTPATFAASGAVIAWVIFGMRLFDLVPVARTQVVESMADGVLVLDDNGRIADINREAKRMLAGKQTQLLGLSLQQALPAWHDVAQGNRAELTLHTGSEERYVDVQVTPLVDQRARSIGRLVILHDITQRRRDEQQLRTANTRLQQQLTEIESLQRKLRAEATHDELTGVFNRRYLMETLALELLLAREEGQPMSVVMIDVDHLKSINDTHGHRAGDVLLQQLAQILTRDIDPRHAVCRYGGDEFVVLLPGVLAGEAFHMAEAWRNSVQAVAIEYGAATLHTTISLGVAAYPAHAATQDDLLISADRALYRAKASGRNASALVEHVLPQINRLDIKPAL
jgi:diguanylate cyclase (GGDEF)-like protein/PAS domain S-box-containing protein